MYFFFHGHSGHTCDVKEEPYTFIFTVFTFSNSGVSHFAGWLEVEKQFGCGSAAVYISMYSSSYAKEWKLWSEFYQLFPYNELKFVSSAFDY